MQFALYDLKTATLSQIPSQRNILPKYYNPSYIQLEDYLLFNKKFL